MKCNELMAGDWITDEYKLPMQIYRIDEERACADSGCAFYEFNKDYPPQPIPITPEILEKNDWYWGLTSNEEDFVSSVGGAYNEHWVYDEGLGGITLTFPNGSDGGLLTIDDQRFNRHLNFLWNDTLYVHELQRALRLCGLDELADNFKV